MEYQSSDEPDQQTYRGFLNVQLLAEDVTVPKYSLLSRFPPDVYIYDAQKHRCK